MLEKLLAIKGTMAFYKDGSPEDQPTFWALLEHYVAEAIEEAKKQTPPPSE